MTAILAWGPPIRLERLAATRADHRPHGLPLHEREMRVPPRIPASVRAEPLALPSRHLHDRSTAVLAHRSVRQRMAAAVRLHRIDGKSELPRNRSISHAAASQSVHTLLFFLRHVDRSLQEETDTRRPFHTPLPLKGQKNMISAQKNKPCQSRAVIVIVRKLSKLVQLSDRVSRLASDTPPAVRPGARESSAPSNGTPAGMRPDRRRRFALPRPSRDRSASSCRRRK